MNEAELGAVVVIARRRLAHRWRSVVAAGVLLGLGFGTSLASVSAARRTDTAYDRILTHADAPDAAVVLGPDPQGGERSLRVAQGVADQRVYAGFTGTADGIDHILTTALLAPIHDRFPLDLPTMRAGRLPRPDEPDEVFVTTSAAERGALEVGQRLHFRLNDPNSSSASEADVAIVGIGTLPVEAVADQTMVFGIMVFSRAFYDAHRALTAYGVSNVDLGAGVDAHRDLAREAGTLGYELQSARSQERQSVDQAVRPLVVVLLAFGLLSFAGTTIASVLVIQRRRARALADDATLRSLGVTRQQVRTVELSIAGIVAVLASATALVVMLVVSPVPPLGPLRDLDPARGLGLDGAVAAIGSVAIVATLVVLTLAFSRRSRRVPRPRTGGSGWSTTLPRGPAAIAGLALARRADGGANRVWLGIWATTAATVLVALAATFVASASALASTPAHYGFDADLLALNAYGDQSTSALEHVVGDRPDVDAATAFTTGSFLVDDRAVPGLAATNLKGEVLPTIVRGVAPRTDGEIVLGQATLDGIGREVGDIVSVRLFTASGRRDRHSRQAVRMRVVGVATFPAIGQLGTDMPRLGIGALMTRLAFLRVDGDPANLPEFTSVRLVRGTNPQLLAAENPDGFSDAAHSTTNWFTDTKPAEIRQLDAAMPALRWGVVLAYAILLSVMAHALWSRSRVHRHDLAVLGAVGATRRQLDAVTAWQVAPFALGAVLVGVPIGVVLGGRAFTLFARSMAVVEEPSTSILSVAILVVAVLSAAAVGAAVAVAVARRHRMAAVLRQG